MIYNVSYRALEKAVKHEFRLECRLARLMANVLRKRVYAITAGASVDEKHATRPDRDRPVSYRTPVDLQSASPNSSGQEWTGR